MPKLVSSKLKNVKIKQRPPAWSGPCVAGVTQSLLSRFLCCRERFRIRVIEGWKPEDEFNVRLEYGNMWHVCEEHSIVSRGNTLWQTALTDYAKELCAKYPLQQEQVQHWYNVCRLQFVAYLDYWKTHADQDQRVPLMQEREFRVPYRLRNGRTVYLLGKWDSVDLIRKGSNQGIWLHENKTKGDIEADMAQRLTFDLQTMFYLTALHKYNHDEGPLSKDCDKPGCGVVRGVRYNVVRRPLAGGKGSIRQKKNQSSEEFYAELTSLIKSATGEEWGAASDDHYYFMRWNAYVDRQDVQNFTETFLEPVLTQLVDWYDWITGPGANPKARYNTPLHWRFPYGVYNPTLESRSTDVENYLMTGSTVGLCRVDDVFPELNVKPGANDA